MAQGADFTAFQFSSVQFGSLRSAIQVLAALVVALLIVLIVSSLIVRRIATVKLFSEGSDQFWPVAAPYEEEEDFVVRYREFDGVQLRTR